MVSGICCILWSTLEATQSYTFSKNAFKNPHCDLSNQKVQVLLFNTNNRFACVRFHTWACSSAPRGLQRKKRWQEVSVSLTQSPFSLMMDGVWGLRQLSVQRSTSCSTTCLIARNDIQTLRGGKLLLRELEDYESKGLFCGKLHDGLKIRPTP